MIYLNETGELQNLWRLTCKCHEYYDTYIREATEDSLLQRWEPLTEGFSLEEDKKRVCLLAWAAEAARAYKSLLEEGSYTVDFSREMAGNNFFVERLASMKLNEEMMRDWGERGETPLPICRDVEGEMEGSFLLEERLCRYDWGEKEMVEADLGKEKEEVRYSYQRLLYVKEVKAFLGLGYEALRIMKRKGKELSSINLPLEQVLSFYFSDNALEKLYQDTRKSPLASSRVSPQENKKNQKLNIFDNEISYLEKVARAADAARVENMKGDSLEEKREQERVVIPSSFLEFCPETIILIYLTFRKMLLEVGHYSEDYIPVPGIYYTNLGLYGNVNVAPHNFFQKVQSERSRRNDHPIEEVINVSSRYLLRLSRDTWNRLWEATQARDKDVCFVTRCKKEEYGSFQSLKEPGELLHLLDYVARDEMGGCAFDLENQGKSLHLTYLEGYNKPALASMLERTKYLSLWDDGGRSVYDSLVCLKSLQGKKGKETSNTYTVFEPFIKAKSDELPRALDAEKELFSYYAERLEGVLPEFVKKHLSDVIKDGGISFIAGAKSWEVNAQKLWLGYFCWAGQATLEWGSVDDLDQALEEGMKAFPDQFPAYAQAVRRGGLSLEIYQKNGEGKVSLIQEEAWEEELSSWIFEDGPMPELTPERREHFLRLSRTALESFGRKRSGLSTGKKGKPFSRKTAKKRLEFFMKILMSYDSLWLQGTYPKKKSVTFAYLLWQKAGEGEELMITPIQGTPKKGYEKVGETYSFTDLCNRILDEPAGFEDFLCGLDPREGAGEPSITCNFTLAFQEKKEDEEHAPSPLEEAFEELRENEYYLYQGSIKVS